MVFGVSSHLLTRRSRIRILLDHVLIESSKTREKWNAGACKKILLIKMGCITMMNQWVLAISLSPCKRSEYLSLMKSGTKNFHPTLNWSEFFVMTVGLISSQCQSGLLKKTFLSLSLSLLLKILYLKFATIKLFLKLINYFPVLLRSIIFFFLRKK